MRIHKRAEQFPLLEEIENLLDVSILKLYDLDNNFPNLGAVDKLRKKGKRKTDDQSSQIVKKTNFSI